MKTGPSTLFFLAERTSRPTRRCYRRGLRSRGRDTCRSSSLPGNDRNGTWSISQRNVARPPERMRRLIFSLICSSGKAANVPKPTRLGITSSQTSGVAWSTKCATSIFCESSRTGLRARRLNSPVGRPSSVRSINAATIYAIPRVLRPERVLINRDR
jgi:hypothetical protein